MIRSAFILLVALLTIAIASADEKYSFTPDASAQTKAAVEAGKAPEKGFPEILSVVWSSTKVRPNTKIDGIVTTSTNINYVGGKYLGYTMRFDQVGPGKFHIAYKIPVLPPFLLGSWHIDIVARTSDGVEAHSPTVLSYEYF